MTTKCVNKDVTHIINLSLCQTLDLFMLQIEDLYEDFHVTKLPLLEHEVRGTTQVHKFSEYLTRPFNPEKDKFSIKIGT